MARIFSATIGHVEPPVVYENREIVYQIRVHLNTNTNSVCVSLLLLLL